MKYWITINEPYVVSESYGNSNVGAPALSVNGFGDYLAIHHIILAHASAYHLYNQEFRKSQNGEYSSNCYIFLTMKCIQYKKCYQIEYL